MSKPTVSFDVCPTFMCEAAIPRRTEAGQSSEVWLKNARALGNASYTALSRLIGVASVEVGTRLSA